MNNTTNSNKTFLKEQMEETHLQEQTSLLAEDKSLPAEQILVQQKEQAGQLSLFVP